MFKYCLFQHKTQPFLNKTFILMWMLIGSGHALRCYNCESSSKDKDPICDRMYWKQMTQDEVDFLALDCYEGQDKYCAYQKSIINKTSVTKRACLDPKSFGIDTYTNGCIFGKSVTTCLCDMDLCNTGSHPGIDSKATWFFASTIIFSSMNFI